MNFPIYILAVSILPLTIFVCLDTFGAKNLYKKIIFKSKLSKSYIGILIFYLILMIVLLIIDFVDSGKPSVRTILLIICNTAVLSFGIGRYFVICEEGIGFKSFIGLSKTYFIPWENINSWKLSKYNKNILVISYSKKNQSNSLEYAVRKDEVDKIHNLLLDKIAVKYIL